MATALSRNRAHQRLGVAAKVLTLAGQKMKMRRAEIYGIIFPKREAERHYQMKIS